MFLLLLQKMKDQGKEDATTPNEVVDGIGTAAALSSPNLYEVFGLRRSQVKYRQPLHPRKKKDDVPLKIKSGHLDIAAGSVAGYSGLKGKNEIVLLISLLLLFFCVHDNDTMTC